MDFTLTLNVSVEHVDGTAQATRGQVLEAIMELVRIELPEDLEVGEGDSDATFNISIWDVDEA
jgi:hypothetical protein